MILFWFLRRMISGLTTSTRLERTDPEKSIGTWFSSGLGREDAGGLDLEPDLDPLLGVPKRKLNIVLLSDAIFSTIGK